MLVLKVPIDFPNQILRFTAPEQCCGILKGLQMFIISKNQLL